MSQESVASEVPGVRGKRSQGSAADTPSCRSIAFLIRGTETYGVRQGTLNLLSGLRNAGWNTPVISLTKGVTSNSCRQQGYDVNVLNTPIAAPSGGGTMTKVLHHLHQLGQVRKLSKRLGQILVQRDVDILHFRWPDLVSLAGQAGLQADIPVTWLMPTGVRPTFANLNARFYRQRCRQYGILPIANSQWTARSLGKGPPSPAVLYLGVDTQRFNPNQVTGVERCALGIPEDAIVFGIVGRMNPGKGQLQFLEGMLAVRDTPEQLHLLLLGGPLDSTYINALRRTAEQANAAHRLHFVGMVDAPEQYYPLMDVAVNSCLGPEAFGFSVVEAMMMGKPVIAHASGGPAETVSDGQTGWHTSDPSPAGYATVIRRALADATRWSEMGNAARRQAFCKFSIQTFCAGYMRLAESQVRQRS